MLSGLRTKSVLNRAAFTDKLEITSELKIDVQLYTRCREQTLPSLKKQSLKSDEEGPKAQGVMMERVYRNKFGKNKKNNNNDNNNNDVSSNNNDLDIFGGGDDLGLGDWGFGGDDNNNNNNNNNDNSNSHDNSKKKNDDEDEDDDSNLVDEDYRIKSYLYGKQRVPFTERDLARLEYKSGAKHFRLLGFLHRNDIKRHEFMGPSYICVANQKTNESDSSNELALSAFIHGCYEKNKVGIGRLVTRKNAAPKYVCLIPRIKASHECFIVNELPFYEDIRLYPFAGFRRNKKFEPNKQQMQCMENLVKSLDLMQANYDDDDAEDDEDKDEEDEVDDDDIIEGLKPANTFNPILQRFYDNLQARAIIEDCEIIPLNQIVAKYLDPPQRLFEKSQKYFDEMSKIFPRKLIAQKDVKNQRAHWNEFDSDLMGLMFDSTQDDQSNVDSSNISQNMNGNKNNGGEEEDVDVDLGSMLDVNQVKKIGTTNPIADFDNLLKKRSSPDLFKKVC